MTSSPSAVPRRAAEPAGTGRAAGPCGAAGDADGAEVAAPAVGWTGAGTITREGVVRIGAVTGAAIEGRCAGRAGAGGVGTAVTLGAILSVPSSPWSAPLSAARDMTVKADDWLRRLTWPNPRLSKAAINNPLTASDAAAGPPMRKGLASPAMASEAVRHCEFEALPLRRQRGKVATILFVEEVIDRDAEFETLRRSALRSEGEEEVVDAIARRWNT